MMTVVFLVALVLLHPLPLFAQHVRVSGTTAALVPPDGFTPSSRFSGFERPDVNASIMVTEIPGPFVDVTRGMTADGLATRGMTLISSVRRNVDGKDALLLHVSQSSGGVTVLKWMLVAGDARRTVMIVGTSPQSAEEELGERIKASLLTTRWNAAAPADHFEGLPYRVSATAALKVAGRLNNMVVLSESGTMGPHGPDAALFVVGSSVAAATITDLQAFAEARAVQTKQLKDIRILRGAKTTVGGSGAYELVAEGTDIATARVVTLFQVVVPDDVGYVLMQGMVASRRAAVLVPEFRRIVDTFTRTAR